MRLVEGSAFESLEGDWRFREIDEMACQIELEVNFRWQASLAQKCCRPVFSRICTDLVDAFVDRAKVLYWGARLLLEIEVVLRLARSARA